MAEKVTFQEIERLSPKDKKDLAVRNITKKFGRDNDYIECHIYDNNDNLLYSIQDYKDFTLPDQLEDLDGGLTSTIFVDPAKTLSGLGFSSGEYNLIYNFHRKKLFDTLQPTLKIEEISATKTELRLSTTFAGPKKLSEIFDQFLEEIEDSIFFKDFLLCFGNNQSTVGVNIALDKGDSQNYKLLVKLYEPLANNLVVGDSCRIAEEIINSIEFKVNLGLPKPPEDIGTLPIQGPNFRIDTRLNSSIPSQWKVYDDFLTGGHSSSLRPLNGILSGSVATTIDYGNTENTDSGYHFENFTHFGSSKERLKNFEYKLNLIELYESQISDILTISGSVSSSVAVLGNKTLIQDKIEGIIGGLDNYEQFLYHEVHPYAWPKHADYGIGYMQISGSGVFPPPSYFTVGISPCNIFVKPYSLYSPTSSIAKTWLGSDTSTSPYYGGQILSASNYDNMNSHNLEYTIPEHILDEPDNDQYKLFINMIGHYFDQIWTYINHVTEINNAHNSLEKGISKDLVFHALSSLGIEAFDQFENEDLFSYLVGTTSSGSSAGFGVLTPPQGSVMITSSLGYCDNGGGTMTKENITKEVWKRLYHSLPYLLKTKGTERGIKALMSCYGVPETILNIKEYGGPPIIENGDYKRSNQIPFWAVNIGGSILAPKTRTFNYQKQSLALTGESTGDNGYFIKTPWSNHYIDEASVDFPGRPISYTTGGFLQPLLAEIRIKPYNNAGISCPICNQIGCPHSSGLNSSSIFDKDTMHLISLSGSSEYQKGDGDMHLVLHPHTGADISASNDSKNWGRLFLTHQHQGQWRVERSPLIPIYDGDFWNVFMFRQPTGSQIISTTQLYQQENTDLLFGAWKTNYRGKTLKYTQYASGSIQASNNITSSYPTGNGVTSQSMYLGGCPKNNAISVSGYNPTVYKYSGSIQESRLYYGPFRNGGGFTWNPDRSNPFLSVTSTHHDTAEALAEDESIGIGRMLKLHADDPFIYATNSPAGAFESLKIRLPLGSNDMRDTSSFTPDVRHNDITWVKSSMPYMVSGGHGYHSSSRYTGHIETHHHAHPDTIGKSLTSEKVRVDSGSVDQNLLSLTRRVEESTQDRQPLDYNDLGIFFSPQTEINEDIVYTLGSIRMDDYIGDPRHQTNSHYPHLDELKNVYYKKYKNHDTQVRTTGSFEPFISGTPNWGVYNTSSYGHNRQNFWDYVKLIQHIDHTLFKVIEQWVPAKVNLKTGLLIEPNVLDRNKFPRSVPKYERLEKLTTIKDLYTSTGDVPGLSFEINISDPENDNVKILNSGSTSASLRLNKSKYDYDATYITPDNTVDPLYGNFISGRTSSIYYNIVKGKGYLFD